MENQEKVRKIRSTPVRWIRFFRLKWSEPFSIGKLRAVKLSFCSAIPTSYTRIHPGTGFWVNPFRLVKTMRPVKSVGKCEKCGETSPSICCCGVPSSNPGHHEVPMAVGSVNISYHGDNNTTGPTA